MRYSGPHSCLGGFLPFRRVLQVATAPSQPTDAHSTCAALGQGQPQKMETTWASTFTVPDSFFICPKEGSQFSFLLPFCLPLAGEMPGKGSQETGNTEAFLWLLFISICGRIIPRVVSRYLRTNSYWIQIVQYIVFSDYHDIFGQL